MLAWLRGEECLRDVPVVLRADLKVPPRGTGMATEAENDPEQVAHGTVNLHL